MRSCRNLERKVHANDGTQTGQPVVCTPMTPTLVDTQDSRLHFVHDAYPTYFGVEACAFSRRPTFNFPYPHHACLCRCSPRPPGCPRACRHPDLRCMEGCEQQGVRLPRGVSDAAILSSDFVRAPLLCLPGPVNPRLTLILP